MTFATKCWNCGSKNFIETVSREFCPDCGIECLYHGSGANQAYNDASAAKWARIEAEDQKRLDDMYGLDTDPPY